MKKIYILLSRTKTIPSRIIHSFVGGSFTHASIAIRPRTDEFYSFARRTPNNPFNAGFIVEDLHSGTFAKYPNCRCALFSLDVSDEAYRDLEGILASFLEHKDSYDYNFLGLLPTRLGIKTHRKRKFTCSQFVATLLEVSGAARLPKHPSLMMPNDFLSIEGVRAVYSGCLKSCSFNSVTEQHRPTSV